MVDNKDTSFQYANEAFIFQKLYAKFLHTFPEDEIQNKLLICDCF